MVWRLKLVACGEKLSFNVFGDEERFRLPVLLGRYVFVLTGTHIFGSLIELIASQIGQPIAVTCSVDCTEMSMVLIVRGLIVRMR
jgi:hypothetical protein